MTQLTANIDVAQVVLYAFWIFFFVLVLYLRREDRREGYPLESEAAGRLKTFDPVLIPRSKTFALPGGGFRLAPVAEPAYEAGVPSTKLEPWPGAPYIRDDEALTTNAGPGSWAARHDVTDKTFEGEVRLMPLRLADAFMLHEDSPDPIGYEVVGADHMMGGTVSDLWVDRGESLVRYYEVALLGDGGTVLMPATFCTVNQIARRVTTKALFAEQLAGIPRTRDATSVTVLEEEKITAYFGAGTLYATPQRAEPIL